MTRARSGWQTRRTSAARPSPAPSEFHRRSLTADRSACYWPAATGQTHSTNRHGAGRSLPQPTRGVRMSITRKRLGALGVAALLSVAALGTAFAIGIEDVVDG